MKLNRKGYMLVEIVIASVLAMGIAYYLLNLTYKFKNTNMDVQESIIYINNKNVITKNIMNDLENIYIIKQSTSGTNINVDSRTNYVNLNVKNGRDKEERRLEIEKKASETILRYGKWDSNTSCYDKNDVSYYEKTLPSILMVGDIEAGYVGNGFGITIPISSIYDDSNYDIKLFSFLWND